MLSSLVVTGAALHICPVCQPKEPPPKKPDTQLAHWRQRRCFAFNYLGEWGTEGQSVDSGGQNGWRAPLPVGYSLSSSTMPANLLPLPMRRPPLSYVKFTRGR